MAFCVLYSNNSCKLANLFLHLYPFRSHPDSSNVSLGFDYHNVWNIYKKTTFWNKSYTYRGVIKNEYYYSEIYIKPNLSFFVFRRTYSLNWIMNSFIRWECQWWLLNNKSSWKYNNTIALMLPHKPASWNTLR